MKAYLAKKIIAETGVLHDSYLVEDQGKIVGIGRRPDGNIPIEDYSNFVLAPGLIDVHTHGALGYETGVGTRDELKKWSEYQIKHGVTGFLPSTASIPLEQIQEAACDVRKIRGESFPNILGLHMEGPFFGESPKIGAQNPLYLQKEFTAEFQNFITEYREVIKYLAIDPELECAKQIIDFCQNLGIRISAAHSKILYQDFIKKKHWGFSAVTHTFNGMVGLDHRHPGLAFAACMDDDIYGEIICDGHHVSYPMIELFLKLKGYQKSILVTDSLSATGMPPGSSFSLGGIKLKVTEDGRVIKPDGGLAGSILTMDQAVRNLVQYLGLSLNEVIYMASLAPATMLGINNVKGSLSIKKDADFIVLDSELQVVATYIGGKCLYQNQ